MKRIGLVLSGGMGKGAYQIGALMAISEVFQPSDFDYISAASVGAINAFAYCSGQLKEIFDVWLQADPKGDKKYITRILQSDSLADIVGHLQLNKELNSRLYVPLFDSSMKELDYYDFSAVPTAQLDQWLQASITLPVFTKGMRIQEHLFFDGAIIDNIPMQPVLNKDLDYIICIYFDDYNYIFDNVSEDGKIIKLVFSDNTMISNSVYVTHESISYMVHEGYERTKEWLADYFANGKDDLEYIYERIEKQNLSFHHRKKRVTGDIVVTNINKYARKIIQKDKIVEQSINNQK